MSSRSRDRPNSTTRTKRRCGKPPTADLLGTGSAVVVLGLASAIAWGTGDFGGGWTSRRAPVLGVSLVVQVLGVLLAGGLAVAARESPMTVATVVLAAAGGVVGVIGILGLYQGLAVGRMGVVAPVTGVLAAALPVAVGIVEDGLPRATVIVGIGLAFVAVALVSRVAGPDGGRSGLEFAIVGGVGIGIFNVIVGGLPVGQVFGPLVVVKIAAAVAILVIAAVGRKPWRIPSAVLPVALLVGVFDMGGNALFVLASQAGRLDVAATLSSLYPVTTVILAILLLGERPTRNHLAGIVAAGVAIALISSGSAG